MKYTLNAGIDMKQPEICHTLVETYLKEQVDKACYKGNGSAQAAHARLTRLEI